MSLTNIMPWLWCHLLTSCLDLDVIYWRHALTVMSLTDLMPWLWWHLRWLHSLGQLWCHLQTSWLDDWNGKYCNLGPWLWCHLLTSFLDCDVINWLHAWTVMPFTMTSYVDCDVIYYDLMPWLWFHLIWPVLRSAKWAPANVSRLNSRKWRQRYCLVGEGSRALRLLNTALMSWLWWNLLWPHALSQLWCHSLT